jgi:histone H3/H4
MEFSISKMKEVIKSASDKRVSRDAANELNDELEIYGEDVAERAIKIADERGRKTVRQNDIRDAINEVKR